MYRPDDIPEVDEHMDDAVRRADSAAQLLDYLQLPPLTYAQPSEDPYEARMERYPKGSDW